MRRSRKLLVPAALLCAVALAACGSGTPSESGSAPANPATGPELAIGVVSIDTGASISPPTADGIEAYASYINDNGGIDGRRLKVVRCDEKGDSATHAACARQITDDQSIIAALPGTARFTGDVGMPAYAGAKLPVVDAYPLSPAAFNSPTSVAVNGGTGVAWGVLAEYLTKEKNAKNFVFTGPDTAGSNAVVAVGVDWAKKLGGTTSYISYPPTVTDLNPTATAIVTAKPDVIAGSPSVTNGAPLLQALQQAGNTAPIAIPANSLPAEMIEAAGGAAEGIYTTRYYPDPSTDEEKALYDGYVAAMKKLDKPVSSGSLNGFMAGEVFRRYVVQAGAASVTRESLLNQILTQDLKNVPFLPPVFGRSQSPDKATLSAVGNPSAFPAVVKDGEFEITGDRLDPYTTSPS